MSRTLGVNFSIKLEDIDKARLIKGKTGTWLPLTSFVDPDVEGKYGDHGFITQSTTKEERDAGLKLPIIGNSKVFYDEAKKTSGGSQAGATSAPPPATTKADPFDDDIPF